MGDRVERLLEVHKAHIEWLLVLVCLVHQYSEIRDLIPCLVEILLAPIANYSSREHYVSVGLLCLDDLLLHEGLVGRLIVDQH